MLHTQYTVTARCDMPEILKSWLPPHAIFLLSQTEGPWEELQLRVGRGCSLTVGGENRRIPLVWRREDMDALMERVCDGSLYAFREAINRGYLCPGEGIRIGLCGHAQWETAESGERLLGVRDIEAVCIRFPRSYPGVGAGIERQIRTVFPFGTLIYSSPGVGKTTLLRSLAQRLGSGEHPLRVALIDARGELDDGGFSSDALISVLSGYPCGKGVEIATRAMNSQVILCDEIGNADEAQALLGAANCGVPVIATAHANHATQLLLRPQMAHLHAAAVFAQYVGIRRAAGKIDYAYDVVPRAALRT